MIDEISITGREAFGHLDLAWKAIMPNFLSCDGVPLLVVEDFLKLHLLTKRLFIRKQLSDNIGHSIHICEKRENFQLHDLFDIVQQISDPDFKSLAEELLGGSGKETGLWKTKFVN